MGHFDGFFGDGTEADSIYQANVTYLAFAEYASVLMSDLSRDLQIAISQDGCVTPSIESRIRHLRDTLLNEPPDAVCRDQWGDAYLLPVVESISLSLDLLRAWPLEQREAIAELRSSAFIIREYVRTVKILAGVMPASSLSPELPEDFVDEPIPETSQQILVSMLELQASKHLPQSSETICSRCLVGNTKKPFKPLTRERLVAGRQGVGYWLTPRGQVLASWYKNHDE